MYLLLKEIFVIASEDWPFFLDTSIYVLTRDFCIQKLSICTSAFVKNLLLYARYGEKSLSVLSISALGQFSFLILFVVDLKQC